MTLPNLLLILLSACLHLVTHIALRRAMDRVALIWWILLAGGILFSPTLYIVRARVPPWVWGILAASAVFEALYSYAIARAYATGDELSILYPLARGTAPALLLLWTALFLRELPTLGGLLGVLGIAAGLYLINLPRLGAWREPFAALGRPGPRWALFGGLCISLYTLLDRVGVAGVDPFLYTFLVIWMTWLVLTPVALRTVGRAALVAELRTRWPSIILAGATSLTAYALVLTTIRHGTPASYAGATREVSVVFGVIVGIVFLHERKTAMKLAGALCVAGGVIAIKLFG